MQNPWTVESEEMDALHHHAGNTFSEVTSKDTEDMYELFIVEEFSP